MLQRQECRMAKANAIPQGHYRGSILSRVSCSLPQVMTIEEAQLSQIDLAMRYDT